MVKDCNRRDVLCWQPARVARAHGRRYYLIAKAGELEAELAGRLKHQTATASALPVVGDWVAALPRPEEAGRRSRPFYRR